MPYIRGDRVAYDENKGTVLWQRMEEVRVRWDNGTVTSESPYDLTDVEQFMGRDVDCHG